MTVSRTEIRATLARYLATHPGHDLARLADAPDSTDLTARTTFPLHVTCSAAAIDTTGRVLLIHHRALDRWLLPGGHVEPEDHSLYSAALRELEEETGIPWQHAVSPPAQDISPIDIDIHEIPANPAKGEPAHWHADFRFAFWTKPSQISIQPEEIITFAWRDPHDLPTTHLSTRIATL
ncbi:NUDIX hydrolase [Spongiactinospora rosea]|uniref:NUDIX hydrolase n=1 Tax=Spongiactinospora rosea TaxID=2248750 RepID=A0A366LQH1_9ACTN|nr:NUDIX domain-containing protein [Spongiactinospora rosea]RBQ15574.1 NUDIX hydrolase [Spongiactinospora rosea]